MRENDRNSCLGISSARPHDSSDFSLFVISTFPIKPGEKIQAFELAIVGVTESELRFSLHANLIFPGCIGRTEPCERALWNASAEFVPWQMGAYGPFSVLVPLLAGCTRIYQWKLCCYLAGFC